MEQEILDLLAVANLRGVTPSNQIKFEIQHTDGKTYIIVASYTEPTFAQLPYNVMWLNADPQSPELGVLRRRVDHVPYDGMTATWTTVLYADAFNELQYYRPVVESPEDVGLDPSDTNIDPATATALGLVILTTNHAQSVAVEDNDPRLTDARVPTAHDHPRTVVYLNSDKRVRVNTAARPVSAGDMLFIESETAEEFIGVWRRATTDDIENLDPEVTVVDFQIIAHLNVTQINDRSTIQFHSRIDFSDGSFVTDSSAVTWSLVTPVAGISINASGLLTAGDVAANRTVTVRGTYVDEQGTTHTDEYVLQIIDTGAVLQSIEIVGPNAIYETGSATYTVNATYDDGTVVNNVAATLTLDATSYATLTGNTLAGAEVTANQTVTLRAEFVDGPMVSTSKVVTINRVQMTSITIEGPTTLDEGGATASYVARATLNDGTNALVPATITLDATTAASFNAGVLTSNSVTANTTVTLRTTYTHPQGGTASDTHAVVIANTGKIATAFAVIGATAVDEGKTATLSARLTFDDATTEIVSATWAVTVGAANASVSAAGVVTGLEVTGNQTATIQASYSGIYGTWSDTHDITVRDVYATALTIGGVTALNEQTQATLTVQRTLSDGTALTLANTAVTWSIQGTAHGSTIDASGTFTAGDVSATQNVTVHASHTYKGVTVTDTHIITVNPVAAGPAFGPRWGTVQRVTAPANYNEAFMNSLTNNLAGVNGDLFMVPTGASNSVNQNLIYVAWPAALGWGYFEVFQQAVQPAVGEAADLVGNFDGAEQYDPFSFEGFNGGTQVTINGEQYIVYRSDWEQGDVTNWYRITYGSSNRLSYAP